MDHVGGLLREYFPGSEYELHVGGLAIRQVASKFGTPLYVYDASVLDRKWARLRDTFPAEFSIYYSVKANPNLAILRHFVAKGAGLEIASAGELAQALSAGCPAGRIFFAGPGKSEVELEAAIAAGVGEIHVESGIEADRIIGMARRLGLVARVGLRVNPGADVQGGAMRMGGKAAPFGVDEEKLDEVVDTLLAANAVEFCGLHIFSGTQILDATVLVSQYRRGLSIARRLAAHLNHPLATLDFGGGLGVPYFAAESELDMDKLREELGALMGEIEGDRLLDGTRFVVEPGRYLVAEAGIYVVRINDIKVSRGKTFYIVDGGMNHHLAASGNLGQVIKRNFPLAVVNRLEESTSGPVDVVGPLCTPLDTLARDVRLPHAEVGDLVGIFQSGAYGLTASPVGFLSHPTPAEVLIANGASTLIRRRFRWEEPLP